MDTFQKKFPITYNGFCFCFFKTIEIEEIVQNFYSLVLES